MPKVNYEWVAEQLTQVRVNRAVGSVVMSMLKGWESVSDAIKPEDAKKALDLLNKLALGHAIVPSSNGEEIWVSAQPGQIKVNDEVRVAHDAFDGALGNLHNGRRGKVVAIRSGDIIITTTDDKLPKLDGVHYPPTKLEKRVR
jgi:hypothetical protein